MLQNRIVSRHGETDHRDEFDLVVIAIGLYSSAPFIPPVAGREEPVVWGFWRIVELLITALCGLRGLGMARSR